MKLREAVHTVYKTQYHLVWITQDSKKILVTEVKSYLLIKLRAQEYIFLMGNIYRYVFCDNMARESMELLLKYILVNADNVLKLPDSIEYEGEAINDLVAVALHAVKKQN